MTNRRIAIAGIAGLLAASMALTGCGSRNAEPSATTGAKKVVKIGLIAPLSGGLSAMGTGMRNSVDLAVKQANAKGTIPGWEIQFVAEDDQASPDAGKNAAT